MLSKFYKYQNVSSKMIKVVFLRKNLHFSWQ